MSLAVDGRPFSQFTTEVLRMSHWPRVHGVNILGSKYLNRWFARQATAVAGEIADEVQATALRANVPNLGIPSDLELTADGINVGKSKAAVYGKYHYFLIAVVTSDAKTGLSFARFIDGYEHGTSGGGKVTAQHMVEMLQASPWNLELKKRIASFPADGALTPGGPLGKSHPSTQTAGIFFDLIGRKRWDVWDLLHRWNVSNRDCVAKHPEVSDFLQLAALVADVFNGGQGLAMAKEVAAYLSSPELAGQTTYDRAKARRFVTPAKMVATRMIVYMSRLPSTFLRNYAIMYATMCMRSGVGCLKHSSSKPLHWYHDLILRMTHPKLIFFVCALSGALNYIHAPLGLRVQLVALTPFEKTVRVAETYRSCVRLRKLLERVSDFLIICLWIQPYLPLVNRKSADRARFINIMLASAPQFRLDYESHLEKPSQFQNEQASFESVAEHYHFRHIFPEFVQQFQHVLLENTFFAVPVPDLCAPDSQSMDQDKKLYASRQNWPKHPTCRHEDHEPCSRWCKTIPPGKYELIKVCKSAMQSVMGLLDNVVSQTQDTMMGLRGCKRKQKKRGKQDNRAKRTGTKKLNDVLTRSKLKPCTNQMEHLNSLPEGKPTSKQANKTTRQACGWWLVVVCVWCCLCVSY